VTGIEELLPRAVLVREHTLPRDIVHSTAPSSTPEADSAAHSSPDGSRHAAAADLRTLCETLVSHTPPGTVAKFVTDQVPEPRAALVLACVLQLTDTDEGARFWCSTPPAPGKQPPPTASTSTTWH
jgi:hypothetical protein